MSGYLELPDGGLIGVRDGLLLGRTSACDVVVRDGKASRRHARLIVEAGVVEIEDLDSSNGTLLNGKPVTRRMLRDGDRIDIGKTGIVFREGALPVAAGRGTGAAPAADASAADVSAADVPGAEVARSSGSASVFDDDDDLFAAEPASASGAPAQAPPSASPPPAQAAAPTSAPTPQPARPQSPSPQSASPSSASPSSESPSDGAADADELFPASAKVSPSTPAGDVVEFEDEVVEVQRTAPRRDDPVLEVRRPETPRPSTAAADRDEVVSSQRILQFSGKQGGKGLLGDDLGQMSAGARNGLVLLVVVAGAVLAWWIAKSM